MAGAVVLMDGGITGMTAEISTECFALFSSRPEGESQLISGAFEHLSRFLICYPHQGKRGFHQIISNISA